MRNRLRQLLILIVGACSVVVFGAALRWTHAKVRFVNQTGQPIVDLRLSGRCFERSLAHLEADESRTLWVHPCGESGVDVAFRSGTKQVTHKDLGYIEGD